MASILVVGVLPATVVSTVLLIMNIKFHNPSAFGARHPPAAIQTVGTASDLLPLDCEPSVHPLVLHEPLGYCHRLLIEITLLFLLKFTFVFLHWNKIVFPTKNCLD